MQLAALQHRSESEDCFVLDHNRVRVRFHTAKDDVEKVIVHYIDNYMPTTNTDSVEMKKLVQVKLVIIGLLRLKFHIIALSIPLK